MVNQTKILITDIYKLLVAFGVALIVAMFSAFGIGIWASFHSSALQSHIFAGILWALILIIILAVPISFLIFMATYIFLSVKFKIQYLNSDYAMLTILSLVAMSFASMGVLIGVSYGIAQLNITYYL